MPCNILAPACVGIVGIILRVVEVASNTSRQNLISPTIGLGQVILDVFVSEFTELTLKLLSVSMKLGIFHESDWPNPPEKKLESNDTPPTSNCGAIPLL